MGNIRDLLVVQWILQNTEESHGIIPWKRKEKGGYMAVVHRENTPPVSLEASALLYRGIEKINIKLLSDGFGKIEVETNQLVSRFNEKYPSEDHKELVLTMRRLIAAIPHRIRWQELEDEKNEGERRQGIYQRLLFGNGADN